MWTRPILLIVFALSLFLPWEPSYGDQATHSCVP